MGKYQFERTVGTLIREGSKEVKKDFERLLSGEEITTAIEEQIVYKQLYFKKNAVWSLLLASGYLKVAGTGFQRKQGVFIINLH